MSMDVSTHIFVKHVYETSQMSLSQTTQQVMLG